MPEGPDPGFCDMRVAIYLDAGKNVASVCLQWHNDFLAFINPLPNSIISMERYLPAFNYCARIGFNDMKNSLST